MTLLRSPLQLRPELQAFPGGGFRLPLVVGDEPSRAAFERLADMQGVQRAQPAVLAQQMNGPVLDDIQKPA